MALNNFGAGFLKLCRDAEGNVVCVGPLGFWFFPLYLMLIANRMTEEEIAELDLCEVEE